MLQVVPRQAAIDVFVKHGILIPAGTRCCRSHLSGNAFKGNEDFTKVNLLDESQLTGKETEKLLNDMRKKASMRTGVNFNESSQLSDQEYYDLTGLWRGQFDDLLQYVEINETNVRSRRNALGIFLMKLRTGLSHKMLATICAMPSRSTVGRMVSSVRNSLALTFVPKHLGFGHISRADLINNHTTNVAQTLFADGTADTAILVLDGTYIYIEKSGDYTFSRRSFSMHKGRSLVKPMVIVSTTGYIVSVLGPYLADGKNNDANITKHVMQTNAEDMRNWLHAKDVFIVDRGFRDSIPFLNDQGITTFMPNFLGKKQSQHTTEEANDSRLVTKVRWVVEAVNGRLKQWKFLANTVRNTEIQNIHSYTCIVSSLCNAYRPDLNSSKPEDEAVARQMLQRKTMSNALQSKVEKGGLSSRSRRWQNICDADVTNFPALSEHSIRELTFGVYQVKQAKHYTDEHLRDGDYKISVQKSAENLLHCLIQSRHISSKQYHVWVEYNSNSITAWYCQCKAGARVVGCCAHVASIIWYLGLARHSGYVAKPTKCSLFADARTCTAMHED